MPQNQIQFNGKNLTEVINFLGPKYINSFPDGEDTKIIFTHAGNYEAVGDMWDVFTKDDDGDIYLESRLGELE